MKQKIEKNIYKIILGIEVILVVGVIALLKLIPVTIHGIVIFISLLCCKVLIDNIVNRVFAQDEEYKSVMDTIKIKMKDKKKFYIVSSIILILLLLFYIILIINIYKLATVDEINKILSPECKIQLNKEDNNFKYFSSDFNSNCPYDVQFIDTKKRNINVFNNYVNEVIENNQPINNSEKITSWDGIEWISEGKMYSAIYQKRNTIIYINSHIKYKEEVKKIMNRLGYTSSFDFNIIF